MAATPVVLFAYNRPAHLRRTLECLRADRVPLIHAFSDGPRSGAEAAAVGAVRDVLRGIDWCELVLEERPRNLGLGRSILTGVSQALERYPRVLVFEDDLICVPGTYRYLSAALERYRDEAAVMSVTGWTHPRVTPPDVGERPYFDGRAECWVWGTWARAWRGMDRDALSLMRECRARGIDVHAYGWDLAAMARQERRRNIWAVRWLYWHMLNRGLCLRPPVSLVEHMGFDAQATNARDAGDWTGAPLGPCPALPREWPPAREHPECARLWRLACPPGPAWPQRVARRLGRLMGKAARRALAPR
jgi:hypothetical protein